jgi:hypothetical protein
MPAALVLGRPMSAATRRRLRTELRGAKRLLGPTRGGRRAGLVAVHGAGIEGGEVAVSVNDLKALVALYQ